VPVLQVRQGIILQEQAHNVYAGIASNRVMQRSAIILTRNVGIGSEPQQLGGNWKILAHNRNFQRRIARRAASIDANCIKVHELGEVTQSIEELSKLD